MDAGFSMPIWVAGSIIVIAYQGIYRSFLRRSRKERRIFMLKRLAVSVSFYGAAIGSLWYTGLPAIPAAMLGAVAALGVAHFTVRRNPRDAGIRLPARLRGPEHGRGRPNS